MTDKKKTEELNEAQLDQVAGGGIVDSHDAYANLEVSHIKPGLTEKSGKRATAELGIRATGRLDKNSKIY